MSKVREVTLENQFATELRNAGSKLVVVDFTASWCGPCQIIAPVFAEYSKKYTNAVFLKVDVDKRQDVASAQGVSAMPTFIFYKNSRKVASCQGADAVKLESTIKQYYVNEGEEGEGSSGGHMDLSSFILKGQCECLNESDDHNLEGCLSSDSAKYLESDCDEQLIISITFKQAVKVHSLKIKGPADKGPKDIKIFINQPRTIDFDMADSYTSVQDLTLTPEDIEEGNPVTLRFVKFQNVSNFQIFVKNNQGDTENTRIDQLTLIGSPINTTNMGDFKRVAGKKGESH